MKNDEFEIIKSGLKIISVKLKVKHTMCQLHLNT